MVFGESARPVPMSSCPFLVFAHKWFEGPNWHRFSSIFSEINQGNYSSYLLLTLAMALNGFNFKRFLLVRVLNGDNALPPTSFCACTFQ
jgi:hypothetical protein